MVNGSPLAPTPANIKYATRVAYEIRERIRLGTFSMSEYFPASGEGPGPTTLASQLQTWLGAQRIEHSTRAGYESAIRFWTGASYNKADLTLKLGDKAMRAVLVSDIKTAIALRPDLTGKTINNYVSVLRDAFALALDDKLVSENPVASIERAKHQKDPPDPFTRDEAERIIAYCLKQYPEPIGNMVEWRFFTGVRTSEMAGLHWANVDLASAYMVVSEVIVRGEAKPRTKTANARSVKLNGRSLGALTRQRKHTQVKGEHVWEDPRYNAAWLEERAFRRSYWTPALRALGIRYRPPNNMRHTCATMFLMAGRRIGWCAQQLGHSVEMFCRTYAKWIDGVQDEQEVAGFEDWLSYPVITQRRSDA